MAGFFEALLGAIFSKGVPLELSGGLNFTGGLIATRNTANEVIDVTMDPATAAGFKATYSVDPSAPFSGAGSDASPFKTIAAAFAYALSIGVTMAVVKLAPGSNAIENITFPATGDWEIQGSNQGLSRATITGNVTAAATAQSFYSFTNVNIVGNVNLTTSAAGTFYTQTRAGVTGSCTLAQTGGGYWFSSFLGIGGWSFFAFGGSVGGAVSVKGQLLADSFYFGGTLAFNSVSQAINCTILGNITIDTTTLDGTISILGAATNIAAISITGVGANVGTVRTDPGTADTLMQAGVTFTNCKMTRGAGSFRSLTGGNVPTHALANNAASAQYEVVATEELLAAGTSGTAGVNVVYTDFSNTVVTEALLAPGGAAMGLLVTGAVGSKARGSLVFSTKGGSAISFTVTGVVTAGALSINTCVTLRRLE